MSGTRSLLDFSYLFLDLGILNEHKEVSWRWVSSLSMKLIYASYTFYTHSLKVILYNIFSEPEFWTPSITWGQVQNFPLWHSNSFVFCISYFWIKDAQPVDIEDQSLILGPHKLRARKVLLLNNTFFKQTFVKQNVPILYISLHA
jgi:hypothetical protein